MSDRLTEIRGRLLGTRPGRWATRGKAAVQVAVVDGMPFGEPVYVTGFLVIPEDPYEAQQIMTDHDFISNAPRDVAYLLKVIDRLELARVVAIEAFDLVYEIKDSATGLPMNNLQEFEEAIKIWATAEGRHVPDAG